MWRVFHGCGHSFHITCLLPNIGSCPICNKVLKRFVEELSKKANDAVLNPDVCDESDDEEELQTDGGDDDDDADHDLLFGEAVPGRLDCLIDNILNWKRPSPSDVFVQ